MMRGRCCILLLSVLAACGGEDRSPRWVDLFGYSVGALHKIEIQDYGFPYVPVVIRGDTVWLPFDTGNMVGLTLESRLFDQKGLACSGRSVRRDSAGRPVFVGCISHGVAVRVLGQELDSATVFEFSHERLPGLVGPGMLPGTRFTLDYGRRILGVDQGSREAVAGFESINLITSPRHPRLILIEGQVQGRTVLIEIDTGKSRTTVDQELVDALGVAVTPEGARVGLVEFGSRSVTISSARVVQTSGISEGLPAPIALGIGSDVLAGFVFTVDYGAGQMWLEIAGEGAS